MAENELESPVLGVAWDGTGYGLDGTIWGGEFSLLAMAARSGESHTCGLFVCRAEIRPSKEPRRCALGFCMNIRRDAFGRSSIRSPFADESVLLRTMLARNVNAPLTSSVGRLFDAVAALLGRTQAVSFEGQAAMELEFLADARVNEAYPFLLTDETPTVIDWEPAIHAILRDIKSGVPRVRSPRGSTICSSSDRWSSAKIGEPKVILSGGCFQNRLLIERTVEQLRKTFHPIWHQRVPPNDGRIALGQAVSASWRQ